MDKVSEAITCANCGEVVDTYVEMVRVPGYWEGGEYTPQGNYVNKWSRGREPQQRVYREYLCPHCKRSIGRKAIAQIKRGQKK